jgi:hypothetical protein
MTTNVESHVFEMFRAAIDDVLDSRLPNSRMQAENFLKTLAFGRIHLAEFDKVAMHLPAAGGARGRGEPMHSTAELYLQLTSAEREDLQRCLGSKVEKLKKDFPEFVMSFREQFS